MTHTALVIPGLDRIAGAEQQVMLLAKGLHSRGWRVSVVALSGSGGVAAAELRAAGVVFTSLEMRKGLADPRGWMRFHRWLRRERPDVVHTHLRHAAWLSRWSRLTAPIPILIDTLHSSATGKLGRRFGYRCSKWLPDHVTAVSEAAAHSHCAAGMVSEHLSVVANGVDVDRWQPNADVRRRVREELGIDDQFLWIAVGRLEPVKNYPALLNAFARVGPTAQLVVLGAGPLEAELKQMSLALGLNHRVHFAGFRPDVARWVQAADGVVLSSRYEGLPMVLLETGACAVPAVATDVPGTREVIVNGETGWLAPPSNPDGLATAMNRLMHMPVTERYEMGQCARRHVMRSFSMDTVLDRWETLYAELLARKTVSRRIGLTAWESLLRRSAHSA